ncbi:heavy metal-binding domain-containing protein [Domibacillus indicus]|uniref:heavy metal-binding domain-containing protein n=1 Tax=Domibacillus indicus TaxID=1437523 RepID=UPI0006962E57|nr:heavy metal-binding domain-containing protein [Domibacillus indicus]
MITTAVLQGGVAESCKEIVGAETVMEANIVRGQSGACVKKATKALKNAADEMKKQAEAPGANAIIGIGYDFETIGQGMVMFAAAGAAVYAVRQ